MVGMRTTEKHENRWKRDEGWSHTQPASINMPCVPASLRPCVPEFLRHACAPLRAHQASSSSPSHPSSFCCTPQSQSSPAFFYFIWIWIWMNGTLLEQKERRDLSVTSRYIIEDRRWGADAGDKRDEEFISWTGRILLVLWDHLELYIARGEGARKWRVLFPCHNVSHQVMHGKPFFSPSPHRLLSFPSSSSFHFPILPSSPLQLFLFSIYIKLFLQVKQCKERGTPTPCLCGSISCKEMKHSQLGSIVCFLLLHFLLTLC